MRLGRLDCDLHSLLGGYQLSGLTSSIIVAGERCGKSPLCP
jgi:hypothetical protein